MVDDLIAIAALTDIALTASLMIRYRRKPFPWLRLLLGVVLCAVIVSIIAPAFITRGRGGPFNLLVITGLCFCVSCLVPLSKPSWNVALFFFTLVMAVGLPGFANRQHDYTFLWFTQERKRDSLYTYHLEELTHKERSYPAGWLADQPFAAEIPRNSMQGRILIPHPLWHSRFSGMYRLEVIEGEAWYPGGPLKDGIRKIEIRER